MRSHSSKATPPTLPSHPGSDASFVFQQTAINQHRPLNSDLRPPSISCSGRKLSEPDDGVPGVFFLSLLPFSPFAPVPPPNTCIKHTKHRVGILPADLPPPSFPLSPPLFFFLLCAHKLQMASLKQKHNHRECIKPTAAAAAALYAIHDRG